MLGPILAGATFGAIALFARKKKPTAFAVDEVTAAERRVVYEAALNCKDPDALRKMSAAFREQGCTIEADMLDKRIALAEAPPELKRARSEAFRKLMRCTDPAQVREAAMVFEEMGATGAAADLNRYASGLEDAMRLEAEGVNDGTK